MVDANADAIAQPVNFDLWLSDADTGAGLTGDAASGNVEAKATKGIVLQAMVAKKALRVQSNASGQFVLSITDSGKHGYRICAQVPGSGLPVVGATLIADDYG